MGGVGAGLFRLFFGRRNSGEPAPTKLSKSCFICPYSSPCCYHTMGTFFRQYHRYMI